MAAQLFPPSKIGPTWQTDKEGNWLLPDCTIGWQVLGWVAEWITTPDGGPFMFTPEQARFVLFFYAIDSRGRFKYRNAVLQRLKGWG